jgi:hypothetical protein
VVAGAVGEPLDALTPAVGPPEAGDRAVTGRGDDVAMERTDEDPRRIDAWHLRALLTLLVHDARGTVTVTELVRGVTAAGFVLAGRPGKVVSDTLRGPVARGWVRRVGRGRYAPGYLPKSSRSRHRARVREARRRVEGRCRRELEPAG